MVRDELTLRKAANAKADVFCKLCQTSFKLTKKNVDARMHAESKHPGKSLDERAAASCRFVFSAGVSPWSRRRLSAP